MQGFLKGQDDNTKSPAPCLVSKNNFSSLGLRSTGTTLSNTFSGHDTSETGKTETPSTSKFPQVDKGFLSSLLETSVTVNNQVTAQGNGSLSEAKASNPIH